LALRRFLRNPLALVALALLLVILGAGALASVLARRGGMQSIFSPVGDPPQARARRRARVRHRLGQVPTLFVRTLYGIRTTEEVALAAAVLANRRRRAHRGTRGLLSEAGSTRSSCVSPISSARIPPWC